MTVGEMSLEFVAGVGRVVGNRVECFPKRTSAGAGCAITKELLSGLGSGEMIGDCDCDPLIHGYAPLLSLIASDIDEVFGQLDAHLVNLPFKDTPQRARIWCRGLAWINNTRKEP